MSSLLTNRSVLSTYAFTAAAHQCFFHHSGHRLPHFLGRNELGGGVRLRPPRSRLQPTPGVWGHVRRGWVLVEKPLRPAACWPWLSEYLQQYICLCAIWLSERVDKGPRRYLRPQEFRLIICCWYSPSVVSSDDFLKVLRWVYPSACLTPQRPKSGDGPGSKSTNTMPGFLRGIEGIAKVLNFKIGFQDLEKVLNLV